MKHAPQERHRLGVSRIVFIQSHYPNHRHNDENNCYEALTIYYRPMSFHLPWLKLPFFTK